MQKGFHLCQLWREQRGSNVAQAAAVALMAAVLFAALFAGGRELGPRVEQAFGCLAATLSGGGGAACATAPGSGTSGDTPWWQDLWNTIKNAWNWFFNNILAPIGNFFKGAWEWLTAEHTAGWWRDFLGWLKGTGWFGNLLARGLGFLMELIVGIGPDGKFSWGGIIFALGTTLLSFVGGVGLLGKIPGVAKALSWLKATKVGRWLAKILPAGNRIPEALNDLLKGRWGTLADEALRIAQTFIGQKLPWLAAWEKVIPGTTARIIKTIGNYGWRAVTNPIGLVDDVIKTITKDVWQHPVVRRLYEWKGVRDIIEWVQNPQWPTLW